MGCLRRAVAAIRSHYTRFLNVSEAAPKNRQAYPKTKDRGLQRKVLVQVCKAKEWSALADFRTFLGADCFDL